MKIATMTFHRTTNYGAIFQTYALQEAISELGYDNEVLDYRSPVIEQRYSKKTFRGLIKPRYLYSILMYNSYIRDNRQNFITFANKYIKHSSIIYTPDNIFDANQVYDKIIVGSDQVWSGVCSGWDKNYLLHFLDKTKRFAYAASFGVDTLSAEEIGFYDDLKKFAIASVREASGARLFSTITSEQAEVVLDPTLLLHDTWINLAKKTGRIIKNGYILVYVLKETKSLFSFAKKLSEQTGLQIIYINDRLFPKYGVINKFYTSPEEWLSLFWYADYIITNSFHGTVFSVNFNKLFWVELLPPPSKVNSRVVDFLYSLNLNNRILKSDTNLIQAIDYSLINQVLHHKVVKSRDFLLKLLNS